MRHGRVANGAEPCPRESLGHLARKPDRGRMLGDSYAHDLPAIMRQNDGHVEQPKRRRRHYKHVDGSDALGLIAQESPPALRRCSPSSHHVLRDCRLADLNAELEQLTMDPGRTPERVDAPHLPNQIANLAIY